MGYVIGKLMGRCGNQFYQIAATYAHALKHGLDPYVTSFAQNCDNDAYYFRVLPVRDSSDSAYFEPTDADGYALYQEIPKIDNTMLIGYWQCFKHFDDYRSEILDLFKMPYEMNKGYVSLHIRRGDYLNLPEKLKVTSMDYYRKAMEYLKTIGDFKYLVFSDDIRWCTENLPQQFPDQTLEFWHGANEIEDLTKMSECEHNITANSTFSYTASWFNKNPEKIVITPNYENMFKWHNRSMIPENYKIIEF
jgi:hypothetical protein